MRKYDDIVAEAIALDEEMTELRKQVKVKIKEGKIIEAQLLNQRKKALSEILERLHLELEKAQIEMYEEGYDY